MAIVTVPYNRQKAVDYSNTWALAHNPRYLYFKGMGGDCTNFVSQCVYAGAGVMNFTRDVGWYYNSPTDRAAAWTSVNHFYRFMTQNRGVGPFGHHADISEIMIGDAIQLHDVNGNYYHNLLVAEVGTPPSPVNILVNAHTFDVYHKPLAAYDYAGMRCIHFDGVRKWR